MPITKPGNWAKDVDFHVGALNPYGWFFEGVIDNVQIYNRAMSDEQILQLYDMHLAAQYGINPTSGESWQLCITPNDGTQDGIAKCSNLVMLQ